MKKELNYISVDGHYGGNQEWMPTWFMRLGGCSTVSAIDSCAYLAKTFPKLKKLYSFHPEKITKKEYIKFFQEMYKYVYPCLGGLTKVSLFQVGVLEYAKKKKVDISVESLEGTRTYEEAVEFLKKWIDGGCCIQYLLLRHEDLYYNKFTWHWFTVTGYEEKEVGMDVIFSSWGKRFQVPFEGLWNTGKKQRGGMSVIFGS